MNRHTIVGGLALVIAAALCAPAQAQNFSTTYKRALDQYQKGNTDQAIRGMEAALGGLGGKPAPDVTIYNNLGWAQMRAGQFDDAERTFAQAQSQKLRLSPEDQRTLKNNQMQLKVLRSTSNASVQQFR